jgi:hypothetical protein
MVPALMQQFNQFNGDRKTLIRKALDTSVGAGTGPYSPLVSQQLERVITNTILRLSPELSVIQSEYGPQKYHEYNRLVKLPKSNGFMGESGVTPSHNAQYKRDTVELKIIRHKGIVTNFLQDAAKNYIDAAATEMENHLLTHVYDLIMGIEYGNAAANQYAFDGLDTLIKTNRWNKSQGGIVPTSLDFLDDMIDANLSLQGGQHKKVFLMSPQMQSLVSRMLTNVALVQGMNGNANVEIHGGWRVMTYRDIPILPVASMSSGKSKMNTPVVAQSSTGSIPAATYKFRVACLTYDGEQEASDLVSTTVSGTAGNIDLTWESVDGAFYYKIYAGDDTTQKLIAVLPALTYDESGTPASEVTGVSFLSNPSVKNPTLELIAPAGVLDGITTPTVDGTSEDYPIVATGGIVPESVLLWDLDKYQGLGKLPYTNTGGDRFNGLVTMMPLAITDDNIPFMIRTYCTLCPSFEGTSVLIRGLRTK